jgi:UDP-GlcNAc3NAcA epimerase
MKKIVTVVGARPQIIKAAALSRAIAKRTNEMKEILIHTGQHYDENMSEVFFKELMIPSPDYNLNVGSGLHGAQTAKMIDGIEQILLKEQPDALVLYGDTNSTLAGAVAASKLKIPVVHIEAGLRSGNKNMPEEINRILCDHTATLLFSPTQAGAENLFREGFQQYPKAPFNNNNPKVYVAGDVMFDNSLFFSNLAKNKSTILKELNLTPESYILSTIHRDHNTDIKENLASIFKALLAIADHSKINIILPLHPRTKSKMHTLFNEDEMQMIQQYIQIIPPVSFLDIIALETNARLIITDSGGIQKEAFFFKKPCVVLRPETEWTELIENGNNMLAGADYDKIIQAFQILFMKKEFTYPEYFGNGNAAEFILNEIITQIGSTH